MEYRRELIIRLMRDWQLAYRRGQDYPEGSDTQQMNAWMAEDLDCFLTIVKSYEPGEAGLLTELYRLDNDTPFGNIRDEIQAYRKHLEETYGMHINMYTPQDGETMR